MTSMAFKQFNAELNTHFQDHQEVFDLVYQRQATVDSLFSPLGNLLISGAQGGGA